MNEESEAGPEAVAAVQQAMEQYDQANNDDDDNPQSARHLEEMMNAMIEQAYDEDMEVTALPFPRSTLTSILNNWFKHMDHMLKQEFAPKPVQHQLLSFNGLCAVSVYCHARD